MILKPERSTGYAPLHLNLPSYSRIRNTTCVNPLAVRIAFTYREGKRKFCVFQQRKANKNATYEEAWDIGAAGYIDPETHLDENTHQPSAYIASREELFEELGILRESLPYSEHYWFFGVARNGFTSQLDLLGECCSSYRVAFVEQTPKVQRIETCEATPNEIARFIVDHQWWVPTAILTAILMLEHSGYARSVIENAFRSAGVGSRIELRPRLE